MGLLAVDALPTEPIEALREIARATDEFDALKRSQVAAARHAGRTWEAIGEALGMSRQSAWSYYTADIRAELAANVQANAALNENDAIELAVAEVKAVRRERQAT